MMPIQYQRQLSQKSRRTPVSTNSIYLQHLHLYISHFYILFLYIQYSRIGFTVTLTNNYRPCIKRVKLISWKHSLEIIKAQLPSLKILKDYGLTEEEKGTYGDRQLLGFDKLELLGRGGFALVWLALKGNQKIALKQIAKPQQSKEAKFSYIKSENIVQIMGVEHSNKDTWIIQELGGKPLSKVLYTMKGEFYKGERVYAISETQQLLDMYEHPQKLIELMYGILNGISCINDKHVTHFDLKPDNILVENNIPKIIDFGSAFSNEDKDQFGMITPEYMAPEALDIMHNWTKYSNQYNTQIEALTQMHGTPKIDVWSYGAIILDILHGVPNWLSYKGKIMRQGRPQIKYGLFAVKGRDLSKIIQKQQQLQLNQVIRQNCNYLSLAKQNQLLDLLKQCLAYDPSQRSEAKELLKHEFFNQI
ncbi:unnamed protein product [Paramecium primaurelia]|uniref:Protein kinase domain-containing protein n=1 Tax=Paramecium primaurelia TaxID=5886 RepID=A0A8S1Q8C8_PARPR|nr:unnamed protein product [Paramecium primaurelia]